MRFSQFQEKLHEMVAAEKERDPETGLHVVRAVGQWASLTTVSVDISSVVGKDDSRMIEPFLAVVSSPEENIHTRNYQVIVGESRLKDRWPGRPFTFPATYVPMEPVPPFERDHVRRNEALTRLGSLVTLNVPRELDLPRITYIEGNPDTLMVGILPTFSTPQCQVLETSRIYTGEYRLDL